MKGTDWGCLAGLAMCCVSAVLVIAALVALVAALRRG